MKFASKIMMVSLALASTYSYGQKKNIISAMNRVSAKEYSEAIDLINAATQDASTKDMAKTWYTRYIVYNAVAVDAPNLVPDASNQATNSIIKMLEIDPKYNLLELAAPISELINKSFTNGVNAFQAKDYPTAITNFSNFDKLYHASKSILFEGNTQIDTFDARALLYKSLAEIENAQYDDAEKDLNTLKSNPNLNADDRKDMYIAQMNMYKKNGNDAKLEATFSEIEKALPNNDFVIDEEINYYLKNNQMDKLLGKIDQAIQQDPKNSQLYFNKGVLLNKLANPDSGDRPSNSDDLAAQALVSLKKANEIDPQNVDVIFMLGVIPFNKAADINKQMIDAPDSKLPALTKARGQYFGEALPYFQDAYNKLNAFNPADITPEQKTTVQGVGQALKSIYGLDNQTDKIKEVNDFLTKYGVN